MRVESPEDLIFTGQRSDAGPHVVQMINAHGTQPLPMRLDLASHSPSGFEWGYAGEGPAQLALAICAAFMDSKRAREAYETVEVKLIAPISTDSWTLSAAQVLAVLGRSAKPALKTAPQPWPWGPNP
jgi:uncharacterized protein (DUF2249 family)